MRRMLTHRWQLVILAQVGLAVALPFIAIPLVYTTSSRRIMRVWDADEGGWRDYASTWTTAAIASALLGIVSPFPLLLDRI